MLYFLNGNGTSTPKTMFLSVYNHLWEICLIKEAKITRFGRAEWKLAKNAIYKNANLSGSSISFNSDILGGESKHIGESPTKFGSHGSPWKCPKIHIFSVSSRFLAFLECLDSLKNLFPAALAFTLTTQKISTGFVKKWKIDKYF